VSDFAYTLFHGIKLSHIFEKIHFGKRNNNHTGNTSLNFSFIRAKNLLKS